MGISNSIMNNVELFSCGLYSTWCFWKPDNILFDCGEGVATHLKNRVYAVDSIFLSHGHGDHILGLPSFIGIRNSARGDKEKPLNIYYPYDAWGINDLRKFIENRNTHLKFDLKWIPFSSNENTVIFSSGKTKYIEAFPVEHCKGSVGYNVLENRKRLKAEYQGQDIPKLLRSGVDKDSITESYTAKLLSYTLDSYSFDPIFIQDSELWIADSTFLRASDRDKPTHMSLLDVVKYSVEHNVKKTVCAHISPRYSVEDISNKEKILASNITIKSPHGVLKL